MRDGEAMQNHERQNQQMPVRTAHELAEPCPESQPVQMVQQQAIAQPHMPAQQPPAVPAAVAPPQQTAMPAAAPVLAPSLPVMAAQPAAAPVLAPSAPGMAAQPAAPPVLAPSLPVMAAQPASAPQPAPAQPLSAPMQATTVQSPAVAQQPPAAQQAMITPQQAVPAPGPDAESDEDRTAPRRRALKSGIVSYNGGNITFSCVVRDVSETGARIRTDAGHHAPDMFRLLIELDGLVADCEVVWRDGQQIGVRFIGQPELASPKRMQVVYPSEVRKNSLVRRKPVGSVG